MLNSEVSVRGRFAGFLYLVVAVAGFFGFYVAQKVPVEAEIDQILAAGLLLRAGLLGHIVLITAWSWLAVQLYCLFEAVGRHMALLLLALVILGSAILGVTAIMQFLALVVAEGPSYLDSLQVDQLQRLTALLLDAARHSTQFAGFFFGFWLFPLACLVFRSGFFPRIVAGILSVLLVIAGLGYIVDSSAFFFIPESKIALAS